MAGEPLRIYLKTTTSQYLRFLWFHEYKEKEMMLGINGLTRAVSVLDSIFPDRTVTSDDLQALHFDYSNATIIKEQVDHISCHADGTFHMKTLNGKEVYRDTFRRQQPLGVNTKTFLDFIIISDLVKKYTHGTSKPRFPNYVLHSNGSEFYVIKGKFSGTRHPIENEMAGEIFPSGGTGQFFLLSGKFLKGVLFPLKRRMDDAVFRKRPVGTILVFKFPRLGNEYLIKGFVFS